MKTNNIIAIDGPSGSGKSTVSKLIAQKLGFLYIDTGAMYRSITRKIMQNKINIDDEDTLCSLLSATEFEYKGNHLYMDNEPIGEEIRHPEIEKMVSIVSANEHVRAFLSKQQREIGMKHKSVIDGRDIGTVLFPDAILKIYLTANVEARAYRRYLENQKKGIDGYTFQNIVEQIIKRDEIDSTRKIAPLAKASDAIEIDSSEKNAEEIVNLIVNLFRERASN